MTGSRIMDHVGPNDYSIVRDLENLEKPKKKMQRGLQAKPSAEVSLICPKLWQKSPVVNELLAMHHVFPGRTIQEVICVSLGSKDENDAHL